MMSHKKCLSFLPYLLHNMITTTWMNLWTKHWFFTLCYYNSLFFIFSFGLLQTPLLNQLHQASSVVKFSSFSRLFYRVNVHMKLKFQCSVKAICKNRRVKLRWLQAIPTPLVLLLLFFQSQFTSSKSLNSDQNQMCLPSNSTSTSVKHNNSKVTSSKPVPVGVLESLLQHWKVILAMKQFTVF